ncbi:MAG: cupin domain-containing protein [Actinomadura sp.]
MTTTQDARLVAGVPWPVIQGDDDSVVYFADKPWVEMRDLGYAGSFIKVVSVDRENGEIIFLYDMAPNTQFPIHEHKCRVIAYTISGAWWYDSRESLVEGTTIIEGVGSTHVPQSGDEGFRAFVVLLTEPGQGVFLRRQHPKSLDVLELDYEYFERLMNLTDEPEVCQVPGWPTDRV